MDQVVPSASNTPAHTKPGGGGEIRLMNLCRTYGAVQAVSDVNLVAAPGEFLTLLGASGSGKTTTLMMIAGFTTPTDGDILVDGRSILGKPPDKRNLGVVFQSYALFPHMNVAENIGFPLRMRGLDRAAIRSRTADALAMVQLTGLGGRRIAQLSGGQQQRVALARALVYRPPVLLMDEPLGALDRQLREQMQVEIKRIQQALNLTVIYVTHDQEEALILSDRIAIMQGGRVLQVGTPEAVYEQPATKYVASFLGESNFLAGTITAHEAPLTHVHLDIGVTIAAPATALSVGSRTTALIRPESLTFTDADPHCAGNHLPAVIVSCEYLGAATRYHARTGSALISVRAPRCKDVLRAKVGEMVTLTWPVEATRLFAA